MLHSQLCSAVATDTFYRMLTKIPFSCNLGIKCHFRPIKSLMWVHLFRLMLHSGANRKAAKIQVKSNKYNLTLFGCLFKDTTLKIRNHREYIS